MKARLPVALFAVLVTCLAWAPTVNAFRAPTERERAALTAAAVRYFEREYHPAPKSVELKRIRISTKDESDASALSVTDTFSPIIFFKLGPSGEWEVDAASDGCLYPKDIHMPASVAYELGACKPMKPSKLFVRDSTRHFKVRPHTLSFAYEALFPGFKLTQIGPWKGWHPSSQRAWAKGWLHYDTCKPNCAEGRYVRRRARVTLSNSSYLCDGRNVFDTIGIKPWGLPEHTHTIMCNGYLH